MDEELSSDFIAGALSVLDNMVIELKAANVQSVTPDQIAVLAEIILNRGTLRNCVLDHLLLLSVI